MLRLHCPPAAGGGDGTGVRGQPRAVRLDQHTRTVFGRQAPPASAAQPLGPTEQFVLLDSPSFKNLISRQHMQIMRVPVEEEAAANGTGPPGRFRYLVQDLNSMNGVLLNRRRLGGDGERAELAEGDVLVVGGGQNVRKGHTIRASTDLPSDLVYIFCADPTVSTSQPQDDGQASVPVPLDRSNSAHLRPIPSSSERQQSVRTLSPRTELRPSRAAAASSAAADADYGEHKQSEPQPAAEQASASSAAAAPPSRAAKPSAKSRRKAAIPDNGGAGGSASALSGSQAAESNAAAAAPAPSPAADVLPPAPAASPPTSARPATVAAAVAAADDEDEEEKAELMRQMLHDDDEPVLPPPAANGAMRASAATLSRAATSAAPLPPSSAFPAPSPPDAAPRAPKVSLASQLMSFATNLNPFRGRGSSSPPAPAAAAAAGAAASSDAHPAVGGAAAAAPVADADGVAMTDRVAAAASDTNAASLLASSDRRKKKHKRLRDEVDEIEKLNEARIAAERTARSAAAASGAPAAAAATAVAGDDDDDDDENAAKRQRISGEDLSADSSAVAALNAAASSSSNAAAAAAAAEPVAPARSGSMVASDARRAMASELSEEFCCAICCELIVQAHALSCAHTFCRACLATWLSTSGSGSSKGKSCPTCRAVVTADPVPVRTLDNAIDLIARSSLTDEEKAERKEKQAAAATVVMPKVAPAPPARAAPAAAAAGPRYAAGPFFGGGFGPFGFGGGGGGGGVGFGFPFLLPDPAPVAAAAAPAAAAGRGGGGVGGRRGGRGAAAAAAADDEDDDGDDDDDGGALPVQVSLEHARSGRSRCKTCSHTIAHGEVRFLVYQPADYGSGHMYDQNAFHHVGCYGPRVSRRQFPSMTAVPGYNALTPAEKRTVTASRP